MLISQPPYHDSAIFTLLSLSTYSWTVTGSSEKNSGSMDRRRTLKTPGARKIRSGECGEQGAKKNTKKGLAGAMAESR
ncbi:Hypothetical protein NTJ_05554 [Nesidiocoris tenuis]|uniref:Uncharacterized protein n=1 Tax=Nesidiocoris tenuis TaxID=355587 RepID=A0ABN7APB3_9HEMI|nr:Hypothetical protein NTJ_05554 [Nesidiocoris tenuis]